MLLNFKFFLTLPISPFHHFRVPSELGNVQICQEAAEICKRLNQDRSWFVFFCADEPPHLQTEGVLREQEIQRLWVVKEWAGERQQGECAAVVVGWLEFRYMLIKMCAAEAHWIMLNLYHTCVDRWRSQIVVPALPGKALKRQLPFRPGEGLFEESFIEERRNGLEQFINRSVNILPLPFCIFSLCSICICAGILEKPNT